jgi:hypothetical protein
MLSSRQLLHRFPEFSERIQKQIKENEEFQSLCLTMSYVSICLKGLKKKGVKACFTGRYIEIKIQLVTGSAEIPRLNKD